MKNIKDITMTAFTILAIPFFIFAILMLTLAATQQKSPSLILGSVFMTSSVVNAVLGLTYQA